MFFFVIPITIMLQFYDDDDDGVDVGRGDDGGEKDDGRFWNVSETFSVAKLA